MRELPTLMHHSFTLEGDTVRLRPLVESDFKTIRKWQDDREVLQYVVPPKTNLKFIQKIIVYFVMKRVLEGTFKYYSNHGHCFLIEVAKKPVGILAAWQIDSVDNIYRLPIIIGEKEYWGKGSGKDAVQVATRFIFEELSGSKIIAGNIHKENLRSLSLFKSGGFTGLSSQEADYYTRMSQPTEVVAGSARVSKSADGLSGDLTTISLELTRSNWNLQASTS